MAGMSSIDHSPGGNALERHAACNTEIAAQFEEIASLLELEAANPYRIRAYRNAARSLRGFVPDIADLLSIGQKLPKLPGIGEDLSGKIREIVATGSCALRERLRGEVPESLVALLSISGLGPKRVRHLYHDLGIQTLQQLYEAAKADRIRRLHGFGKKTQEKVLRSVELRLQTGQRMLLAHAAPLANRLVAYLRRISGVAEVTVAGSFRRLRESVGDLDILVSAEPVGSVTTRILEYPEIAEVLVRGPARVSIRLRSGVQVDMRVIEPSAYGAALVYFTGSKAHNIAIRRLAQQRGLKISEYGVFRGSVWIAGKTETAVYKALGLSLIPPELREDRGEIAAAAEHRLPKLIDFHDLKGDLHAHTSATDGLNSLEEMAEGARLAGLQYLAITDHTQHLKVARGMTVDALLQQSEQIDAVNRRLQGVTLLKGAEVDILENGDLDLPDEVLMQLDMVVVAVHSFFDLPRHRQTKRLLHAMEHPKVIVLAHPSGRLIGEREPMDIDISVIMRAARNLRCCLELNAQPRRMDLADVYCRQAKDQGVLICINSDAHRDSDFANLRYGVGQARRGWLGTENVLNTRPLTDLRSFLERR